MDQPSRSKTSHLFQSAWEQLRSESELVPRFSAGEIVKLADFAPRVVIVALDYETRSLPVVYAGSDVMQIAGVDMTGKNALSLSEDFDPERSWLQRKICFNHPCGRHEVREARFAAGKEARAALTALPVNLSGGRDGLLTLAEAQWTYPLGSHQFAIEGIRGLLEATYIDIGGGKPDHPEM